MKKLTLITALILATSPSLANFGHGEGWDGGQIDYTRVYYQGQGGEFTIYPDNDPNSRGFFLSNSDYAGAAKGIAGGPRSFQSFCIEVDEHIYNNLDAWVSEETAGLTQPATPGSHAWKGGDDTNSGDDLDPKTAYLYYQFATGQLTEYAYAGTNSYGLNRSSSAGALQRLIWNIEGEDEGHSLVKDDRFQGIKLTQAQVDTIAAWNNAYDSSGWTGIGRVRVLQLYQDKLTAVKQDQLYLIPAPGAALLGGIGLAMVGWLRRRKAA